MPSFSEVVGAIVSIVVLSVASGNGNVVWKTIGELRRITTIESRQGWGCPSLKGKEGCVTYDSDRYR